MQEWYHWGWQPRRMTRREIQEMIKNMQKTWVIHEKAKEYHKKEEKEAEDILEKLNKK